MVKKDKHDCYRSWLLNNTETHVEICCQPILLLPLHISTKVHTLLSEQFTMQTNKSQKWKAHFKVALRYLSTHSSYSVDKYIMLEMTQNLTMMYTNIWIFICIVLYILYFIAYSTSYCHWQNFVFVERTICIHISTSKFWGIHMWLHAVLTKHTTNYHTNSAAPMKTYQLICTSECEHKLFTLHTQPSNLWENKHHYQQSQSHVLTTLQCDCASFRLLIVHTTIGQEVSEQNATESSLEEQQHNKQEPNVNTLVVTMRDWKMLFISLWFVS
jgi:hypothetical protein